MKYEKDWSVVPKLFSTKILVLNGKRAGLIECRSLIILSLTQSFINVNTFYYNRTDVPMFILYDHPSAKIIYDKEQNIINTVNKIVMEIED